MFKMNGYRIIETKEEFLSDWNPTFERYDGAVMPIRFDIDKATFPLAVEYHESWDNHFCGSWFIVPIEEARENILAAYREHIAHLMEQEAKLTNLSL